MKQILTSKPNKQYDLVVRGIPFGGHAGGRDADGEYFHENTSVSSHPVPIMYAHGNQINSPLSKKGDLYGITEDIWKEADGLYYGVNIFDDAEVEDELGNKHKAKQYFRESADKGLLFSSIGSLRGADLDVDRKTGAINKLVVAELSLIDKRLTPNISPKNYYAVARTKAIRNFIKAGIVTDVEEISNLKCDCGEENSDSLFSTEDIDAYKADNCNCNKPKGEDKMTMIDRLKALIAGKADGEDLTATELATVLKAGEPTVVTTSTANIDEIVKKAVADATNSFTQKLTEMQTAFQNEVAVMKATQDVNGFNTYLSSMLNVKITPAEAANYAEIYANLQGLEPTAKEKTVVALKAQIEAKTPIAELLKRGVHVLPEDGDDAGNEEAEIHAMASGYALKAGAEVFSGNKTAQDGLQAIAQKALAQVTGGNTNVK